MTHRTAFARVLAATAVLAAAPALAACQATNPVASQFSYEPSDGVSAHAGDIVVRNMVVIGEKKGGPATLSAAVANNGPKELKVGIATGPQEGQVITVPAHDVVLVGPQDGAGRRVDIASLPVTPGALMDVELIGTDGAVPVKVPTHLPTGIYASYTPGEATSEPAAEETEAAEETTDAPETTTAAATTDTETADAATTAAPSTTQVAATATSQAATTTAAPAA